MSGETLLAELDEGQLREIAKKEDVGIPKGLKKDTIVQFLEANLTLEKIKHYVAEYTEEEIERETTVKEKIKRKRLVVKEDVSEKLGIPIEKMVLELLDAKIHSSIIEEVLRQYYDTRLELGKSYPKQLEAMKDETLQDIFNAFIKAENDRSGRYFEWRFAKFMRDKLKCKTIKFREHILGKNGIAPEIDISGYDGEGNLMAIAECKARGGNPERESIAKWLSDTENIARASKGTYLEHSYFASTSRYTEDIIKLMKAEGGAEGVKNYMASASTMVKTFFSNDPTTIRRTVKIHLYEELDGEIQRVFPES